ncbi:MAG: flagellar protein FlgN [Gammaproteobacteria bacterium]
MTTAREWQSEIGRVLDEEIRVATALLGILRDEREILKQRDMQALSRSGEAKHRVLAELDALDKDRLGLAELAGIPSDREGFGDFLESLHQGDGIRLRWHRMVGLLEECRERNEANGRLVALQRSHVEKALAALRGVDKQPSLYGPDGNRQHSAAGLPLSSA